MTQPRRLVAVKIGGKRHIDLLRAGYRTHHTDGVVTWLEYQPPKPKRAANA